MRNMQCSLLICSSCLTCFFTVWFHKLLQLSSPAVYFLTRRNTFANNHEILMWLQLCAQYHHICYCCHQSKHFYPNHIFSDCSVNIHTATVLYPDVIFVHCYFQKGNHIARLYFPLIFGLLRDWFLSSSRRLFSS